MLYCSTDNLLSTIYSWNLFLKKITKNNRLPDANTTLCKKKNPKKHKIICDSFFQLFLHYLALNSQQTHQFYDAGLWATFVICFMFMLWQLTFTVVCTLHCSTSSSIVQMGRKLQVTIVYFIWFRNQTASYLQCEYECFSNPSPVVLIVQLNYVQVNTAGLLSVTILFEAICLLHQGW